MWLAFKKILHGTALFTIFLLLLVILVDLVALGWSWWPVSRAAMGFDARSAIFIIAPLPVGETAMSGVQAMVIGGALAFIGVMLYVIRRSKVLPGLGGGGTTFMAALSLLSGVGMVALGGYLATTGNLSDPADLPSIIPSPVALMVLRFTLLAHWHSIMMGAIFMSAIVLFHQEGPPLWRTLKGSIRRATLPPVRTDNALIMIPRMYLMIVGFYSVYYTILLSFTVEPDIPDFGKMPLWEQLLAFAEASVWEEVLSRVLMLGVPLMLYHLWTRQEGAHVGRYLVGGGFSIDTAAFVLIVFQALVFALAHVAGWDFWKVLPTTLSGIAFGYLFLKKGLWASIILHFLFDYLGMTAPVMERWGIPAEGAMNGVYMIVVLVGLVLMVHYLVIIFREGPQHVKDALADKGPATGVQPDGNP